ncbi:M20/M25/M40 family metallo-hydrolase [Actinophytocola sp.]|uniref:M20/M25/M40 family metallo-hydrolase n=1 Tax=Actinophytocola sp. TaxID=1872138 RepID=UPI002ED59955
MREEVHRLMPGLWRTLADLVGFWSVSANSGSPMRQTAEKVAGLFRHAGIADVGVTRIQHESRTSAPLVYAHASGPKGAPTVLLYAHYDVQPADASKWTIGHPFAAKEVQDGNDVRLYGRGAADDKSGIVMHLGAIRAMLATRQPLPVTIKIVIEGEEETGDSVLDAYLADNPGDARFHADVVVVADTGNVRLGAPTLTTTLRGIVVVDVELRTLDHEVHSGMYGGPAPDAFMALAHMLSTLHDPETGAVAVSGLTEHSHTWPPISEHVFRTDAGVVPGVPLVGTGTIEGRLYGKPSINVVGLSGPPGMDKPTNVLCPSVTARLSVRLAPDQKPSEAYEELCRHLTEAVPWGLTPKITRVGEGGGFVAGSGRYREVIEWALRSAYQMSTVEQLGQGGSIPLVNAFRAANPLADVVLWGCEEPRSNIHGNDESVSRSELEHMTLAEANLLHAVARKETTP